jgi:hypothetical protein
VDREGPSFFWRIFQFDGFLLRVARTGLEGIERLQTSSHTRVFFVAVSSTNCPLSVQGAIYRFS